MEDPVIIKLMYLRSWIWLTNTNRYEIDLSDEVLNIDFNQKAIKISEVKVGGIKNICRLSPV